MMRRQRDLCVESQIPGYLCPSDNGAGRKDEESVGRSNYVACYGSAESVWSKRGNGK